MGFNCGIIGLPNVGKSTLFNALTSAGAAASNFAFCTVDPNVGRVPVPDERLEKAASIAVSKTVVYTQMEFIDIAGLVKGASRGEGLGNRFLGHIRSVDAIAHVVRCFSSGDVMHVMGSVDPVRDIEVVESELMIADLDSVEKKIKTIVKLAASGDKQAVELLSKLELLREGLQRGIPVSHIDGSEPLAELPLLTAKPAMYIANIGDPADEDTPHVRAVREYAKNRSAAFVTVCSQLEAEIAELPTDERNDYRREMSLAGSGLDRMIKAGYELLGLITFLTAGPKEARAWTIEKGTNALNAAGKIHTDFKKGFIRAEVIGYEDYVACNGELGAKEKGKMRLEGKDYMVIDGDVIFFRVAA
ncbi:MAG: ribosome-binding ATPase YchF [bacterium]|nr:MAG: ribosome-binding ATPase YchF [bacterium]